MIKVNLIGASRKKAKAGFKLTLPSSSTPIVLILIFLASAGFGYWWYTSLSGESARLDTEIQAAQARKAQLDVIIKQDQIFEARKKALENRVTGVVRQRLRRNCSDHQCDDANTC